MYSKYGVIISRMQRIGGDLLDLGAAGHFDVIIHADQATPRGDKAKLGMYTSATIDCKDGHKLTIVNAYTQFHFGPKYDRNADYDAIRAAFRRIKQDFSGKRIGYPLIGAGLAGGDWNIISKIIEEELKGENHTLVEFEINK